MKYSYLLFDADNTVLDFDKSEERALQTSFEKHNLKFDSNVLSVYRRNNIAQWQRYEKGLVSRDEILLLRFVETFAELGVTADVAGIADMYEQQLHLGFYVVPHAEEILSQLQGRARLFIVSNGVLSIQNSRMLGSGLNKYFEKRFISEEIGVPKPQAEFFVRSFAQIEGFDKTKALVIGDSLTSDIQGGINVGLDTCWFNPNKLPNTSGIVPTYEITDLRQILKIVQ